MFTRESLSTPEDVEEEGAGITLNDVSRAIMIWVCMNFEQGRKKLSVADVAIAFNTTPDLVREACDTPYLYCIPKDETDPMKQFVDVDGE